LTDQEVLQSPVALSDAQFAVALSYGFEDWKALKAHLESIQKARELMLKGEYAGAKAFAEKAVDLAPDRAEPHVLLGHIHIWDWVAAERPEDGKKLDLAQECARKALSINADNAAAHNLMGAAYLHKGHAQEAISESKKAVSLSPSTADLHADMAAIYRGAKMPEDALRAIMKAIQLDPTQGRYLELLGKVYADLGRHDESYAAFGEAAETQGTDSEEAKKRADIPNLDRQRESFSRFLQMDEDAPDRQNTGLQKVFRSVFPIGNSARDLSLEYVCYQLGKAAHGIEECARGGMTYEAPMSVVVRLALYNVDKATGEFVNYLFRNPTYYDLSSIGRLRINHCLGVDTPFNLRFLRKEDVFLTARKLAGLSDKLVMVDDIDGLVSVGDLLEHLFRTGLTRTEKECRERMDSLPADTPMPEDLIGPEPISAAIKEFFSGI